MRRRGWKAAAIFILILAALDLGLAQIAKRVLPNWPALMAASNPRQRSAVLHHALRPMMQVHSRVGEAVYPFNTNSLAMVDAEAREVDLQASGCRVLAIGDSFTEGFGVGWDKSFAGILARRWQPQGVELLNSGVVGYSPTIYYRRVRQLIEEIGLRFDSLLVFIDVSDTSDEWESFDLDANDNVVSIGRIAPIPVLPEPTWRDHVWFKVQDNSLIAHLAKDLYGELTRKPFQPPPRPPVVPHPPPLPPALGEVAVPPPIDFPLTAYPPEFASMIDRGTSRWPLDPALWRAFGENGIRVAAERMDRLLLLLRKHRIPLTIAFYPWPDQLYADDLNSAHRLFWRAWAEARGIAFIDLFPAFFQAPDRRASILRYYLRGDVHWSAEGHALTAEVVGREFDPRRFCR